MAHTILIAGGGTGGHVYPAIAIAEALREIDPTLRIEFVGGSDGIEGKAVPSRGFPLHRINIGKFHASVGWSERLRTLLGLPVALLKALLIVLMKRPRVVLGVGGYASAPVVFWSGLLGFRTFIWEPNAHPGLANRLLSRWARTALVVFDEARNGLRSKDVRVVGLPVRRQLELPREIAPHADFNLFVFGGSQGAKGINDIVLEAAEDTSWHHGVRVVHQTGPRDFERVRNRVPPYDYWQTQAYIDDIERLYAWADLVVCRSGASTLAELAACGKPSVLIPFPFSADDHQLKNAQAFAKAGAAVVIEQKNLTRRALVATIEELRRDRDRLSRMATAARRLYQPRAAAAIAEILLREG
jgi:UDP-N-acetylglucosamine--N-acetylmuramyl-(pentapeptide) pyrophosphoryl-undecaprenol N-acetylglucosamine transferase